MPVGRRPRADLPRSGSALDGLGRGWSASSDRLRPGQVGSGLLHHRLHVTHLWTRKPKNMLTRS